MRSALIPQPLPLPVSTLRTPALLVAGLSAENWLMLSPFTLTVDLAMDRTF